IVEPEKHDSVFKLGWYDLNEQWNDYSLFIEWTILKNLRSKVNQLLEAARTEKLIKSSLEASVDLYVNAALYELLQKHDLKSIFITSSTTLNKNDSQSIDDSSGRKVQFSDNINITENNFNGSVKIVVREADLHKCPRCWNYSSIEKNNLCQRCDDVLKVK
ncbi:669_t:CDS:2, partial [Acaulospora morrowiae]